MGIGIFECNSFLLLKNGTFSRKNLIMRTTIILLTVLLLFFACENSNEAPEVTNTENTEIPVDKSVKRSTSTDQVNQLENLMQWTSYLAARVLLRDSQAESEFIAALIDNSSNILPEAKIIRLRDLLPPKSNGRPETAFKEAFREEFLYFLDNNWWDPNGGCRMPRGGAPIPDPTGGGGDCVNYCLFEELILENNCLEFYLPLGYNPGINSINSSAHPLDTSGENDRFEHPGCGHNLVINSSNLHQLSNVLIARPYRPVNFMNVQCSYDEYPFDFTLFLSN